MIDMSGSLMIRVYGGTKHEIQKEKIRRCLIRVEEKVATKRDCE